jgi:predicted small integral membrane protein
MYVIIALLILCGLIRLFFGKKAGAEAFGVVKIFVIVCVVLVILILLYFTIGFMMTGVKG